MTVRTERKGPTSHSLGRRERRRLADAEPRVIRPVRRRIRLGDVVSDAHVIWVIAGRDFKVRYKQSVLGPVWLVFQPVALLGAFLVAFGGSRHGNTDGASYLLFALVGLCVWSYFQASALTGASSLIRNEILVRRTPCPRIAFPLAGTAAALPVLALVMVSTVVGVVAEDKLSYRILLLPVAVLWLLAITLGVVCLLSAGAVYVRDVTSALPILIQVGAFIAPVGYSLSDLGPTLRTIVELNPLTGLIEFWRWVLIHGPSVQPLAASTAIGGTVVALVAGWALFSGSEPTMSDVI